MSTTADNDNGLFRKLGRSGLLVSTLGLGCNNFGRPNTATATEKGTRHVVDTALDYGINLFDTADVYGAEPGLSESHLGKALGKKRDRVVLATKFGMPLGSSYAPQQRSLGSRSYIIRAVESSLRRLGTDWIDLYQLHTPDPCTPAEETLSTLDTLIKSGKVRYIGNSNHTGWQIVQAEYLARFHHCERYISSQNHYNLLDRRAECEVIPAAKEYGIGILPYFPLANGLLTGKYKNHAAPPGSRLSHSRQEYLKKANWQALDEFSTFACKRGLSELELAFGWLASQKPVASVIAGATKPEQVIQNAQAIQAKLSNTDLAELDRIFPPPGKVALF